MAETHCYSHPTQDVRHSYPLSVKSAGFGTALSLCLKTMPYILMRLGVLVGFTLAALIWLALCGGVAALLGEKNGGGLVFLIGFGLPAGVFFWLRHYVLYILKIGHVAVLTRLITAGTLPDGVKQVEYGKKIVQEHFAQTNVLFVLDSLINGVVGAFNSTLNWIADLLPIPGLSGLMGVINAIIKNATTYIDETIFSYNIARGDENVWRSSADGLVYYAQNAKPILKTAVYALLVEYALTFVIFLVMLAPAALFAYVLPATAAGFAWIFAVILAFNVRAAVVRPVLLTMVALSFHVRTHQQKINSEYANTLSSVSEKFRELVDRGKKALAPPAAERVPEALPVA